MHTCGYMQMDLTHFPALEHRQMTRRDSHYSSCVAISTSETKGPECSPCLVGHTGGKLLHLPGFQNKCLCSWPHEPTAFLINSATTRFETSDGRVYASLGFCVSAAMITVNVKMIAGQAKTVNLRLLCSQ